MKKVIGPHNLSTKSSETSYNKMPELNVVVTIPKTQSQSPQSVAVANDVCVQKFVDH
jgi:hypothetical protein